MSSERTVDRAIVVVNYGSHELVAGALRGVDLPTLHARAVVVDNLQSPAEREAITAVCAEGGWLLVPMGANFGFGHAVNAGIEEAQVAGCRSFVVLNPDAEASTDSLETLFAAVEAEQSRLVAPRVLRGDGRVWFEGAIVDVAAGRTRACPPTELSGPTSWLTGACLAVHAELWDRVGGFDPDYFLYWEDVDLSWRVRAAGGTLALLPEVSVVHHVGGTQGPTPGSRAKSATYVYFNCRNRLLFAAKHLDRVRRRRWLRTSPGYAREVLLRGGRRELIRRPRLVGAAIRGTFAGAWLLLARRRGR